jgi:CHAT domain
VDETSYVDFDLLVERVGRRCRARVLASPAGTTTPIEFPLPIRNETLQIFILTVGRPRQGVRRIDSPIEDDVKDLGARLYRSVFRDQIRDCLKSSQTEAKRQGRGLRLRLHLDGSTVNLPWEFLFDEAKDSFLCLSRFTPIVRYLEIDDAPMLLKLDPPLRVLGVISSPSDYPPLDVEGEWTRLQGALSSQVKAGIVHVERLSPVTIDELLEVLQRGTYHVLHFIGHGGFRESTEEGVLIFEDELGASREVPGEDLGMLLHDHPSLRLVLLNSCEGARSDVRDPFSGTAQNLVRRRIPSVIAMQFEITDTAAVRFSQSFYGALASNYPIDAAVAEARKSVRLMGNTFEWGTPVLYMLSPDGRVFELPKDAEDRAREALEQDRAEQDGAEQERAEQERAEQEHAEQERAEQERAEQERAEQERAEQERAERERAERERAERERAERERAERERAERERAERARAELQAGAGVEIPSVAPPPGVSSTPKRKLSSRAVLAGIVVLALVAATFGVIASRGGGSDTTAVRDYLWNAYDLALKSAQQVPERIQARRTFDADALYSLQQGRQELLESAMQLDVPDAARDTNDALVQALQYGVISDGYWARYAGGEVSRDFVSRFDKENTAPAELKFKSLFNDLGEGIPEAPPSLDPESNF